MRGEQLTAPPRWAKRLGSPPLARGTGGMSARPQPIAWITPACAGNSRRAQNLRCAVGDHPRLRGEQNGLICGFLPLEGSPPLARGTGEYHRRYLHAYRITPACAGNRMRRTFALPSVGDHPRLRGEQLLIALCIHPVAGSPPLARGTVTGWGTTFWEVRITPACAGNRSWPKSTGGTSWDHPRLRGEQGGDCKFNGFTLGSPPLARGTANLTPL